MMENDLSLEHLELDSEVLNFVKDALLEDIPTGDITSDNLNIKDRKGYARLVAKEDLILSGCDFFTSSFLLLDSESFFRWHFADGEEVIKGQTICELKGNLLSFLKAERVALNYLGHLSGIASLAYKFKQQTMGTNTKILDTRKTFPNFRKWEKRAVVDGGCYNHRINLSDAVMIKENHIQAAGGMKKAVEQIRKKYTGPIEVETTNLDEVKLAVSLGVQRIMLDNMNNEEIMLALKEIPNAIETEASGNMTLDRVRSVAELGVDFISVGAITHSAPTADISLIFEWKY